MNKETDVKERLMDAATALIEESGGDTAAVTTRAIAQRAGAGVGLVNYHFQTKERLLNLCVQRIIGRVVASFQPEHREGETDQERLADWAAQVFDFLFEHEAVSRVSILDDLARYAPGNNSHMTQQGFAAALRGPMPREKKRLMAFTLTAAMQVAFVSWRAGQAVHGVDLSQKIQRNQWIQSLVRMLFQGADQAERGDGE